MICFKNKNRYWRIYKIKEANIRNTWRWILKNKKLLALISMTAAIGIMVLVGRWGATRTKMIDLPLVVRTNESKPSIQYGMNQAYVKATTPAHDLISIEAESYESYSTQLNQLADDVKEVNLTFNTNEWSYEQIQKVIQEILQKDQIEKAYIYITGNQSKKIQESYRQLAEQTIENDKIQLVYPVEELKKVPNGEYIGIEIAKREGLEALESLINQLENEEENTVKLMIYDSIVENNGADLSETLDVIEHLYYSIASSGMEDVKIIQQSNLGTSDLRIAQLYESLTAQEWLTKQGETYDVEPYEAIETEELILVEDTIELLVPYEGEVEYIEYKLNGQTVAQSQRYPYRLSYDVSDLDDAYYEVRVIAKIKNQDEPYVKQVYFKKEVTKPSEVSRAPRTSPTYDLEHEMSYTYPHIPVLMYHEFADIVGETEAEQSITVGTDLFEAQIVALVEAGYTAITFKDLEDYFKGVGGLPPKPVIITTDDGYLSNYEIAYPILKEYNMPATYFITSQYIGVETTRLHFTWEHAREMEASGLIDIQSHTHSHPQMSKLPEGQVIYEAMHCIERIESHLGERDVRVLSYPQFMHNDQTIEWLEESGIDLQITDLAEKKAETVPLDIKRIHVSNETMPDQLIKEIERLTTK